MLIHYSRTVTSRTRTHYIIARIKYVRVFERIAQTIIACFGEQRRVGIICSSFNVFQVITLDDKDCQGFVNVFATLYGFIIWYVIYDLIIKVTAT